MKGQEQTAPVLATMQRLAAEGRIMAGGWETYEGILPAGAGPVQRAETRMAFYAGAQHLYACVLAAMSPSSEATEADLSMMAALDGELRAFHVEFASRTGRRGDHHHE